MASKLARTFVRNYASHSATAGDHSGGARLWKILSFTVALPGVGLCFVNAELAEKAHRDHYVQPEFVPYEHLRIRSKKFPWGDGNHSLFHSKYNALPDGFED